MIILHTRMVFFPDANELLVVSTILLGCIKRISFCARKTAKQQTTNEKESAKKKNEREKEKCGGKTQRPQSDF